MKLVGTQKHYQANPESPLFDELCNIVRKTVGLKEPLLDAIASLLMVTENLENERWRVLENAHNKRNLAEYEGSYDVDEQTVEALIRVALNQSSFLTYTNRVIE